MQRQVRAERFGVIDRPAAEPRVSLSPGAERAHIHKFNLLAPVKLRAVGLHQAFQVPQIHRVTVDRLMHPIRLAGRADDALCPFFIHPQRRCLKTPLIGA